MTCKELGKLTKYKVLQSDVAINCERTLETNPKIFKKNVRIKIDYNSKENPLQYVNFRGIILVDIQ